MDNLQMQSSQVLQNLLNILGVTQHVEAKDQNGLNFQITSKNQCIEVQFEGSLQTYLFSQTGHQLENENQSNFIISKNSQQFSLATILNYFYIKHITQQSPIQSKSDFISLCNHFMTALGQNRVFSNIYIIWSQWNTYWSRHNQHSYCYSNCSGQCNQKICAGGQCIYYFPTNELNNPYLPEQEKKDPNNRFNDQLFYLASVFDGFVKEETKQFENFFFSFQKIQKPNRMSDTTLDIIQVQLLQGNVIKLKSLQQLYAIDTNQIKSISILSLDEQFIPKGEQQRKQLYDFILSLKNLNSLEIQLEAGIYHMDEEKFEPLRNQGERIIMQSVTVPKEVVENFVIFLLQIKVEKLSLMLDEFCYRAFIDLTPIFNCLPNINNNLKTLQISVARRRMHKAQHILKNLCKLKQLEFLNLRIKEQAAKYHSNYNIHILENFEQWEVQLRKCIKNIQQIQID